MSLLFTHIQDYKQFSENQSSEFKGYSTIVLNNTASILPDLGGISL